MKALAVLGAEWGMHLLPYISQKLPSAWKSFGDWQLFDTSRFASQLISVCLGAGDHRDAEDPAAGDAQAGRRLSPGCWPVQAVCHSTSLLLAPTSDTDPVIPLQRIL